MNKKQKIQDDSVNSGVDAQERIAQEVLDLCVLQLTDMINEAGKYPDLYNFLYEQCGADKVDDTVILTAPYVPARGVNNDPVAIQFVVKQMTDPPPVYAGLPAETMEILNNMFNKLPRYYDLLLNAYVNKCKPDIRAEIIEGLPKLQMDKKTSRFHIGGDRGLELQVKYL